MECPNLSRRGLTGVFISFFGIFLFFGAALSSQAQEITKPDQIASLPEGTVPVDLLQFDVLMDGSKIGEHIVNIGRLGEDTRVAIDVDLKVNFGPFTLYSYDQTVHETWRDDRLISLKSVTDNDGEKYAVEAGLDGSELRVAVNDAAPVALPSLLPSTYWNKNTVEQTALLATLDGELKEVEISRVGVEEIEVKGAVVEAERYAMRGDIDLDIWYDTDGRWVYLTFDFKGNKFDYVLR